METHTVDRAGRARRDHALGDLPAPVPRAGRDRGAVRGPLSRCASSSRISAAASARSRTRRWSRSRSRSRARPGARCGSRRRRRVDGHLAAPRHAGARAHGRDERRSPARAETSSAGSTRAPTPTTGRGSPRRAGDAAPGPYRWESFRVDASVRLHEHRPVGQLPRVRRDAPAVDRREPGRRDRAALRPRSARAPPPEPLPPGEEIRPGGKPLDADLVGDVERSPPRVGWDEPKPPRTGRGVSVGLLAAGAHPVSTPVVRMEADGRVVVLVGTTEMGQGPRTVVRPDRRRGAGDRGRDDRRARHRHPLHAV